MKVTLKCADWAGDSFLGAMTLGPAQGRPVEATFTFRMAAGTAAVLTDGTELCRHADVERLFQDIRSGREKYVG